METKDMWKQFEQDESIPDRDWDFEDKQNEVLYQKYVKRYLDEIGKMDEDKTFDPDNSFNGVKANHHIMYKYKVNESGETLLMTADGCIGYEFLVEFDKLNPAYGIYYGCRGHIKAGDQKSGIKRIEDDWENLKVEVTAVLNNTFVDKDFSKRFQSTNNANNKTYWPFWISLGADEDVIKVAARATKLICNIYKKYINGWKPRKKKKEDAVNDKEILVRTQYTEKAWDDLRELIKKERGRKCFQKYWSFIRKMEKNGIIKSDDRYEKCWKFLGLNNQEVHCLIKLACKELGILKEVSRKAEKDGGTNDMIVPWEYFTPVFLSKIDRNFENLKDSVPKQENKDKIEKKVEKIFILLINS